MKRKIKVAQYGLGAIGKMCARYMYNKGCEIVAAFARSSQVGQNLGEIIGVPEVELTVSNSANLEEVLKATKPDIMLFSTKPNLIDIKEAALTCLKCGVNAIDIGENAFWPWTNEKDVAAELDACANENGVTMSASGCPDVSWGTLVTNFCATSNSITKIRCDSFLNLETYAADYMFEYHGVGLTKAQFEEKWGTEVVSDDNGHYPCLPGDQNAWLCAKLGLTIKSQTMQYVPVIRETDFPSKTFGRTIKAGELEGLCQICRTETEEGITIELAMGGKTDVQGADQHTVWTVTGEPTSTMIWDDQATYEVTCATAVNRIPNVIDAEPGFVTTDKMPDPCYIVKPMNEYVHSID